MTHPGDSHSLDNDRPALGVRQPWAELILRGIKTIEVRRLHTTVRGPIYIYASRRLADQPFALRAARQHGIDVPQLPTGVVLGSVEIVDSLELSRQHCQAACVPAEALLGKKGWRLANPQRFEQPIPARFTPYGIWFYPWKRRTITTAEDRQERRRRRRSS